MPVGTDIADDSADLAPLPLIFVLQGCWVTGDQLDSGHLILQDDQPDGHIGARRAFAPQLEPTVLYRYTITY